MAIEIRKATHPYMRDTNPLVRRFVEKVHNVGDPFGCWLWNAKKDRGGYGLFSIDGKFHKAHRVALILCGLELGDKKIVRHLCGVPSCVNPAHLREGSQKENAADRSRHGHDGGVKRSGAMNGRSKLSKEAVIEIRNSTASLTRLAKKYGVSKTAIRYIKINKTWKQ